MLKDKLRPCPFCGSTHEDGWTWIDELKEGCFVISHYCYPEPNKVNNAISIYGNSAEQCIERWNANGK